VRLVRSGQRVGIARTDPTRLRQCLYNLLSNAVRYTDEGFVELGVAVHGRSLTLAVRDSGCGIPEESLATLFEPFQQAPGARGGTGLGLALVNSLAELLGGRCRAESELGVGSTFTLELPYEPLDHREAQASVG
jgi:signal transduction histidine kinase